MNAFITRMSVAESDRCVCVPVPAV